MSGHKQKPQETSMFDDALALVTDNALGGTVGAIDDLANTSGNVGMGMSGIGLLGGLAQMYEGLSSTEDGSWVDSSGGAASATSGALGLLASSAGQWLLPTASSAATGGTASAGLGTAVGGAGALPVLAAAAAGWAAGTTVGTSGQDFVRDHGVLGENDDGTNRDFSDLSYDWAVDTEDWARDRGMGDFGARAMGFGGLAAGAVASTPMAAAAGVMGIGEQAWDLGGDAVGAAADFGGGLADSASDAWSDWWD